MKVMVWNIIASIISLLAFLGMLVCAIGLGAWIAMLSGLSPVGVLLGLAVPGAFGYFGLKRLFGPAEDRGA